MDARFRVGTCLTMQADQLFLRTVAAILHAFEECLRLAFCFSICQPWWRLPLRLPFVNRLYRTSHGRIGGFDGDKNKTVLRFTRWSLGRL